MIREFMAAAIGVFLVGMFRAEPCLADVYPAPPQSPAANNGFVDLPAGSSGFIDPAGFGYCRHVTNGNSLQEAVPISTAAEWKSFRAAHPPGVTEAICCRPQTVTLCQGAPGGTVARSLSYMPAGQQVSPTATCIDSWGSTYSDSQAWTCGTDGIAAPDTDGQWSGGAHTYVCAPNAHTTACTASCGGGTQTTYNSCGDVQAVTACNTQACCTPNASYTVGGCSASCGGGYQTVTWYNSCGQVSSQYNQSCNTQACYTPFASYAIGCYASLTGNGISLVAFYDTYGSISYHNPGWLSGASVSYCGGDCTNVMAQAQAAFPWLPLGYSYGNYGGFEIPDPGCWAPSGEAGSGGGG
jgi:hypothetical protein